MALALGEPCGCLSRRRDEDAEATEGDAARMVEESMMEAAHAGWQPRQGITALHWCRDGEEIEGRTQQPGPRLFWRPTSCLVFYTNCSTTIKRVRGEPRRPSEPLPSPPRWDAPGFPIPTVRDTRPARFAHHLNRHYFRTIGI